ncbi:aminodeoxychorismate synthase component I [Aquabacter cavernae]|uniref:aminodeoxychorismate synthase component I n=1 Tax=Aquabacter cavernae TaxID=2496029 RepID=UPI001FE0D816|nr:aminodeoxychorismate synthase component I [Aquabacter cavernae]
MPIIPLPYGDPAAAFAPFAQDPVAALLQSCAPDGERGRYSYVAVEPLHVVSADASGTLLDGQPVPGDPFSVLDTQIASLPRPQDEGWPVPFRTGAVGYLGYELGGHLERLPTPKTDPHGVPHMVMGLYDTVLAFDHRQKSAFLLSTGSPERVTRILARLAAAPQSPPEPDGSIRGTWQAGQERAAVEAAVARAIAYIHAGDIFQANITHRLTAARPAGLNDLDLFLRLRALSPAPFAALLACGAGTALISASPERFLRLSADGMVESRPIKGTRPRHADPERDAALGRELLASAKDRAENLMIVDLMRNDLGRVSALGSVRVPVLNGLETFASVHHLVSAVESRLRPGFGPVDLLRACFPGGSVTGAPKIRAMEIIHELEPMPRGPYCGAIAWIGVDGAMDSSIVIRTIVRAGETLLAQGGGGIVADSDPTAEYEESLVKLAPLRRALEGEPDA